MKPTKRCQLRYQHPRTLQWLDCAQLTLTIVTIGGDIRRVCDEHEGQVKAAIREGLADRLQWVEQPKPTPRRRRPAQLTLLP